MTASERKVATILFADLVGSTALASTDDPEQTRVMLDRFYDAMSDEIEASGGTIEKFAGDAVMAVFGVPAAHEDHAERALHTALAMRARLHSLFGDRLQVRIGVNSGEVMAGAARMGSSFVSGDAVNVTARLEQGAAPGEILVGERTATLVGAAFEMSEPRIIEAKGKEGGVPARRLISALATARPRGVLGLAFVGRELEIASIQAAHQRAVDGRRPVTVTVIGEPGVGKSRLVDEFERRLDGRSLWREGRCLSYGRGLTYRPMADVLQAELGLHDSDSRADVLARLGARSILGLALGLDVTGDLDPRVARERFAQAWVELIDDRTRRVPVVLVIEDIHWAEEPLIELLRSIRLRVTGPLLIVTTARPEATDQLAPATRIELAPLSTHDAVSMVTELLGGALPEQARDLVIARAEGNPLFIEELLASLVDRGIIAPQAGGWAIARPIDASELPDTVQAVLAARIDLLPKAEKRALQAASVVGRVFWDAPVLDIVADTAPDLSVLERRSFVYRMPESSFADAVEYSFRHQLIREVAYASLPKAERGRLHAAVARYLERDPDDARAALLAHHYEQSVSDDYVALAWADQPDELDRLQEKALYWLRLAAQRAASRYETGAAVAMYERAIGLATDDQTRFDLWRRLASVHSQRYDTRAFVDASERAIALAPDDATATGLYAELALRSCTAWLAWSPPLKRDEVQRWIDRAMTGSAPDSRERAMALVAQAWHADRSETTAAQALAVAERIGDPQLIGWALRVETIAAMQAGRYDVAANRSERILALLDQIDDPGDRETLVENTALRVAAATGRFDEARQYGEFVTRLVADLTPHNRLHGVAYALEIEELVAGWDRIRQLEPRVEQAVLENQDTPCLRNARSLLVCALAEQALGDDEAARRLESLANGLGIVGHDRELTAPRLRLAMLRGNVEQAQRLLREYGRPTLRFMFDMAGASTWLDAAAAFGPPEDVEREAPGLAVPGTVIEPFALRALGIVREDPVLLERADSRFSDLGQEWYGQLGADLRRFRRR